MNKYEIILIACAKLQTPGASRGSLSVGGISVGVSRGHVSAA